MRNDRPVYEITSKILCNELPENRIEYVTIEACPGGYCLPADSSENEFQLENIFFSGLNLHARCCNGYCDRSLVL